MLPGVAAPPVSDWLIVVAQAAMAVQNAAASTRRGTEVLDVVMIRSNVECLTSEWSRRQGVVTGRPHVVQNFHPSSSSVPQARQLTTVRFWPQCGQKVIFR